MMELAVRVAKYFSVGVLFVASLPVLLPFLFLLLVFGFTFVLPLGCALGGLPYLRKYVGMLYKNLPDPVLSAVRRWQPVSPASPIIIMAYLSQRFREFLHGKMREPKVLKEYYPPDVDPTKFPPRQPKNRDIKVRMRLPMRIECNACGNCIDKGTNFNSLDYNFRKTDLGLNTLRFIFKCNRCSAELIMKTDPQKGDYTMESGATLNFEPWRPTDKAADAVKSKQKAEEMDDATTGLEIRTLDSKQEDLDGTKCTRAPHAAVGTTDIVEVPKKTTELKEDEAVLRSAVLRSAVSHSSRKFVRRRDDDHFDDVIEDCYFKEEFQQRDRKRRKEQLLEGNYEKRNETLQTVSS